MQENSGKHKHFEFLYEHLLDLLFGIPSLVTILGWIKCVMTKSEYSELDVLLSCIIILNAVTWIIIARNYYGYPTTCKKTQYRIISKTIKYKRNSNDDSLTVTRAVEVKSNVNGLDRIKDRFLWTGNSEANLPKRGKNVVSIHPEDSIGIWKYFSVNFNQVISKGDMLSVSYTWKNLKDCRSSSPFVSTDTEYETKNILMEIDLGTEYHNREIIIEEYRSIESECPIHSARVQLDDEGRYKWAINKPKRYRYFRARWTWNIEEP